MSPELEMLIAQVQREAEQLANAPQVELGPPVGRCSFCGRVSRRLTASHDYGPNGNIINERYRGECCGG